MRRTSDDDVRDEQWNETLWEKERHIMELERELEEAYSRIDELESKVQDLLKNEGNRC